MKKLFAIIFISVLVVAGLSANFKVGAELGWGFDFYNLKMSISGSDESGKETIKNSGLALNLVGEYDFDESMGIKASAGLMFAGKAKAVESGSGKSGEEQVTSEKSGLYFDFATDFKYSIPVNKDFALSGLAGVEMLYGYLAKGSEIEKELQEKYKNFSFGLNVGLEASFEVIENLYINGGVTGAWFFVNKCEAIETMKDAMNMFGANVKMSSSSFYIRPYLGATYAF